MSPTISISGWTGAAGPWVQPDEIGRAAHRVRETTYVVGDPATGRVGVAEGGSLTAVGAEGSFPVVGVLPALYPEWLGDRGFNEAHGTRFAYVAGAMANGIATPRLVIEMARAGCLGFFGAGGLALTDVERAIDELIGALGTDGLPWGANLIHSPQEPALEAAVADLYIRRGVRRVSAAAYMALTPAVVRYAYHGISADAAGNIVRPNAVFAKVSRPEVAQHFLNPAPGPILDELVAQRLLSVDEARLARRLPVAEDITVEGDSGGHTDNRPLAPLFSSIQRVRDEAVARHGYPRPIRLGAAGGIGTPQAAAAAFSLGAAYVLTGTVNQACVESGLSEAGRSLLAEADVADVAMAPAADMFELGVELQVLKRGTMFAPRAHQLYAAYRRYGSLEAIPADEAREIESRILGQSLAEAWTTTAEFWFQRDPAQIERAEADPHHRMALVFRSYLGQSSRWAIEGTPERRLDFQIWCGPAMGAFNSWTEGSFLAAPKNRTVAQVAMNLLEGAAALTRAHQLRTYGADVPPSAFDFRPRPLGQVTKPHH